jgi:ABC-type arginine transport system permease subunit
MQRIQFGAIDLPSMLAGLLMIGFCYSAWLTSIVFCAAHGARLLLIASATFLPIGIVHGVGVWFGGW